MKYTVSIPVQLTIGDAKLPITISFELDIEQLPGATATPIEPGTGEAPQPQVPTADGM